MRNAELDESQGGIKIARRNINNFRCANDTTPMAENEKELKTLLMRVKEKSDEASLNLNIQKTKIMYLVPSLPGKYKGKSRSSDRLYFLGFQNHCGW